MARGERSKMLEKGKGAGEKCGGSAVKILNTIKQMEISLKRQREKFEQRKWQAEVRKKGPYPRLVANNK